jgi:hypothetical protein
VDCGRIVGSSEPEVPDLLQVEERGPCRALVTLVELCFELAAALVCGNRTQVDQIRPLGYGGRWGLGRALDAAPKPWQDLAPWT